MRLRAAARHAVKNICVGDKTLPRADANIFLPCSIKLTVLVFDSGCRGGEDIFTAPVFYCGALSIWFTAQIFCIAKKV